MHTEETLFVLQFKLGYISFNTLISVFCGPSPLAVICTKYTL